MKDAPLRHRLEYLAYLPAARTLERLPLPQARAFGRALGSLGARLDRRRLRIALENLELALPDLSPRERRRIAVASFRHLGETLIDALAARRLDAVELCRRWSVEGFDHVLEAESAGRGVLYMTAHLGCWEVLPWLMGASERPMVVVGRPADNPHLDAELRGLRERFGNSMVTKQRAARALLRRLRDGDYAGILIDQRVRPEQGVALPFFGRPALTSTLPAQLSLRTGAPVVPGFAYLAPRGRYRIVSGEPLWPDPQSDSEESLTARYLTVVEAAIRATPELWMWMHRRWRLD